MMGKTITQSQTEGFREAVLPESKRQTKCQRNKSCLSDNTGTTAGQGGSESCHRDVSNRTGVTSEAHKHLF